MRNRIETNLSGATRTKIVVSFLSIYLIWGTTFLGIRIAVESIPAFMMASLRFFLAGGVMLLLLLARGGRFPSRRQWRSAVIAGGLMLTGGIGLVSFAEQRLPSAMAALVVATIPIWITLFEWLGFKGKRPSLQTLIGLGFGFGGAILLFMPALMLKDTAGVYDLRSMAIVLLGAMIFAIGSLYSRRAPLPEDTRIATASEMLAGGVLLFVISLLTGEPARFTVATLSTRSILALLYLIVFGSIISYTAYLWLLKTVEPAKVSTNFYVNPVIALFVGWLVADEPMTLQMIGAAGVILLGVVIMNTRLPRLSLSLTTENKDEAHGNVMH
jgi:drug/metabolite transporter (DMT)-like permease